MSNGKKWKTASKYVGKRSHGRRWTYRVCGGKVENVDFNISDTKNGLKLLKEKYQ